MNNLIINLSSNLAYKVPNRIEKDSYRLSLQVVSKEDFSYFQIQLNYSLINIKPRTVTIVEDKVNTSRNTIYDIISKELANYKSDVYIQFVNF